MGRILFKEEQKFGSPGLYLSMGVIYAVTISFFLFAMYSQFVLNEPIGDEPMTDKGLVLTSVLITLVLLISGLFLFGSKLVVIISSENITLTFRPLIKKPIIFQPKDIQKYKVRKYKPIKEYGGWGVKQGTKKWGKAYNVKGNIGLQLHLNKGTKILIGTERGESIDRAVRKMMEINKDG